jgi:ubiquinone/menaquinone biosynthesis C-methylase UbiE
MTEIELIVDLHRTTERQGPGSVEDTLRALGCIDTTRRKDLKIADIGCGTGGQTLTLAENTHAQITALDLFPEFLEVVAKRAHSKGLQQWIQTLQGSIDQLPFEKESFDIIWSEGSIYNIGFEAGIKNWREYLKPGGYLAVSEITWITHSRPGEIQDFWESEYPEIDRASCKIELLEENGYTLAGYFILPQESWIGTYYKPLEKYFDSFLELHDNSEAARKVVEAYRHEIALYRRYHAYYSYGFYIARKV